MQAIHFTLNGRPVTANQDPDTKLLAYLRGVACLKGAKEGCSTGHCGACTVLVNGRPTRSCILLLRNVEGADILTIEGLTEQGLAYPGGIHPIQKAFLDAGAVQCGFCTPGMILAAKALLDRCPSPNRDQICQALAHNYCRCTGYVKIIQAVELAAHYLQGGEASTFLSKAVQEHTDLVKGMAGAAMETPKGRYMGRPVWDADGQAKVSGALPYAGDLEFPGLLYGAFVWAGIPCGRIRSLDLSAALAQPGVLQILTAPDVPGVNGFGAIEMDQPVFCDSRIRFVGDAIALVIAKTRQEARAATALVNVSIDKEPGIYTMEDAQDRGSLFAQTEYHTGDLELARREPGLVIVSEDFDTPAVEHAYLEPESATGVWNEDGTLTLYACTQSPFEVQSILSRVLDLPTDRIQVIAMPLGGSFGSKCDPSIEPAAAVAAYVMKAPVQITLTREESLRLTNKRHAFHTHYELGLNPDGEIRFLDAQLYIDGGPYRGLTPGVLEQAMIFAAGPYRIPNGRARGKAFKTNNIPAGAFRGFGINQAAFSMESLMDMAADRLGIDPFELRLKNALDVGDLTFAGQRVGESVGIRDTLHECRIRVEAALERLNPLYPVSGSKRLTMGVACGFKNVGVGKGAVDDGGASILLRGDGTYLLTVTGVDMGQGFRTAMHQLACEELDISWEMLLVVNGDTQKTYRHNAAVSERQTVASGRAVVEACRLLRQKLAKDPWKPGEERTACYQYSAPKTYSLYDSEGRNEAGWHYRNYPTYAYTTQAAIVETDLDTRQARVLEVIAAHDVGRAINPHVIEGQIEGSCSMGIGYALTEAFPTENGIPTATNMGQLGLPTAKDTPDYQIVLIEDPEPEGPYGAKGISEVATVPITPAVANAVSKAFGVRIHSLPIQR